MKKTFLTLILSLVAVCSFSQTKKDSDILYVRHSIIHFSKDCSELHGNYRVYPASDYMKLHDKFWDCKACSVKLHSTSSSSSTSGAYHLRFAFVDNRAYYTVSLPDSTDIYTGSSNLRRTKNGVSFSLLEHNSDSLSSSIIISNVKTTNPEVIPGNGTNVPDIFIPSRLLNSVPSYGSTVSASTKYSSRKSSSKNNSLGGVFMCTFADGCDPTFGGGLQYRYTSSGSVGVRLGTDVLINSYSYASYHVNSRSTYSTSTEKQTSCTLSVPLQLNLKLGGSFMFSVGPQLSTSFTKGYDFKNCSALDARADVTFSKRKFAGSVGYARSITNFSGDKLSSNTVYVAAAFRF